MIGEEALSIQTKTHFIFFLYLLSSAVLPISMLIYALSDAVAHDGATGQWMFSPTPSQLVSGLQEHASTRNGTEKGKVAITDPLHRT